MSDLRLTPAQKPIVRKFVKSVWDACPWAAPQEYLDRKARAEKLMEDLLKKVGVEVPQP